MNDAQLKICQPTREDVFMLSDIRKLRDSKHDDRRSERWLGVFVIVSSSFFFFVTNYKRIQTLAR